MWILDSGASSHATNDFADLSDAHEFRQQIVTAGKWIVQVTHRGTVCLQLQDKQVTLSNVLYSHDFTERIISVKQLTSKGCVATFNESSGTVHFRGESILIGKPWYGL